MRVDRPAFASPWPRLWRLGALVFAAWLVHAASLRSERVHEPAPASLDEVRRFFPDAALLSSREAGRGGHHVLDAENHPLGYVLTTSPESDDLVGYTGPNNLLVALDLSGRVTGVELLSSGDTPAHVSEVNRSEAFWRSFSGWAPALGSPPRIEAVAGSTLTSLGIAEALERRLAGRAASLRFPEPLALEEVREVVLAASSLQADQRHPDRWVVLDAAGERLGYVLRTSPHAEGVRGHAGPTEALVLLDAEGREVRAVRLRRSYDTAEYVERVRDDGVFLNSLAGRSVEEWARLDFREARIEGVSGATETSYAVAAGVRRRLAADLSGSAAVAGRRVGKLRDWALLGIVGGSLMMAFSGLRRRKWVRRGWQALVIAVFGLWCGDLVSLALLAGWARNGVAWETAPALVLLVAVTLLVPWASGRQIYCHHLCPHGVAQEWLGRGRQRQVAVPARLRRWLEFLPIALLGLAFLAPLGGWEIDLAQLEPFDAWTLPRGAAVSGAIALVGLVVSLRVPMAYCRYGCPTGALLKFLRAGESSDRFGLRDSLALGLLVVGTGLMVARPLARSDRSPALRADSLLSGRAFGSTWSVKVRGPAAEWGQLDRALAAELERIESTMSHWRSNSATAGFNATSTTQPMELPPELIDLVAECLEVSRASDGAFDITVAPLVRAWGFGPGGLAPEPPTDGAITALVSRTGWAKLTVDTEANTLRKGHPDLELDLGGILQGYAADRLAMLLTAAGQTNFLIEVGGELLARGAWRVAVEDPAQAGQVLRSITLRDGALATSGTYRTRRADGDRVRSHLIDPRTGRSVAHDTILASVRHSSCARADAWATAMLVQGAADAPARARAHRVSVLTVHGFPEHWEVQASEGFPPPD